MIKERWDNDPTKKPFHIGDLVLSVDPEWPQVLYLVIKIQWDTDNKEWYFTGIVQTTGRKDWYYTSFFRLVARIDEETQR